MATPNLQAVTPHLLADATAENDLNQALRLIHEAAGITDSEVAEVFFSNIRPWGEMDVLSRLKTLINYIKLEGISAEISLKRH